MATIAVSSWSDRFSTNDKPVSRTPPQPRASLPQETESMLPSLTTTGPTRKRKRATSVEDGPATRTRARRPSHEMQATGHNSSAGSTRALTEPDQPPPEQPLTVDNAQPAEDEDVAVSSTSPKPTPMSEEAQAAADIVSSNNRNDLGKFLLKIDELHPGKAEAAFQYMSAMVDIQSITVDANSLNERPPFWNNGMWTSIWFDV